MATLKSEFECEFIEKPPKALQSDCPVCQLVLREPYQATCCGYNFCQVCIERNKVRNIPCPCCKAEGFYYFPDKRLQRSLYGFKVKCVNQTKGCQWVGELGQLDNHLNTDPSEEKQLEGCQFTQIHCFQCAQLFLRGDLQRHQSSQCLKSSVHGKYAVVRYCKGILYINSAVFTNNNIMVPSPASA